MDHEQVFNEKAEDNNYLFVKATLSYGWGIKPPKDLLFLYDIKKRKAKCIEKESGKAVKMPLFYSVNADKVFDNDPVIKTYYNDANVYYLMIKNGKRMKEISVQGPEVDNYTHLNWIFDTFVKLDSGHPLIHRWERRLLRIMGIA